MEILQNFAVFEGPDGSGTTTQLNILDAFFHPKQDAGNSMQAAEPAISYPALPPFYKTFEPTDGIIGRIIRSGLKNELPLLDDTLARLFAADRNEHVFGADGIAERCRRGELVISDRYLPSSLVYQGIACGDELPELLNRDFPGPEMLIFFDIDPEIAQKRIAIRNQKEIYEQLDFQILVRQRYKALLPVFADKGIMVEVMDASLPPEEVFSEVWRVIQKMSIFKV